MTDTLTAPVTEEDMGKVRSIFDQALNAIVGMSQLSKDVEALRAQVGDLTNTVTRYRSQIDTLDEALYRTRQERDEARSTISTAAQAQSQAESRARSAELSVEQLRRDNAALNDDLIHSRRESDDHLMRALEAEEKLAAANRKLEEVREHLKSLFPEEPSHAAPMAVVTPPPPEPEPAPEFQPWWSKPKAEEKEEPSVSFVPSVA